MIRCCRFVSPPARCRLDAFVLLCLYTTTISTLPIAFVSLQTQHSLRFVTAFGKDFIASVGPKAAIADSRKFCQLSLQLEYSAGYSFAVYSAAYGGFADLDGGVTGTVKSNYYFAGETEQVRFPPLLQRQLLRDRSTLTFADVELPNSQRADEGNIQEAG